MASAPRHHPILTPTTTPSTLHKRPVSRVCGTVSVTRASTFRKRRRVSGLGSRTSSWKPFGSVLLERRCTCLIIFSETFKQPPKRPQLYPEQKRSQTEKLAVLHHQSRTVPRRTEAPQTNNDSENFQERILLLSLIPSLISEVYLLRCSLHHYSFHCLISPHFLQTVSSCLPLHGHFSFSLHVTHFTSLHFTSELSSLH